jgi:hypothetical protein
MRLLLRLPRVLFLTIRLHNRKIEQLESEEKRKESRADGPEHRSFIGTTSHERDPNMPSII